jgi:hypothetical protein
MVVVERPRTPRDTTSTVDVTSIVQNRQGRMLFGVPADGARDGEPDSDVGERSRDVGVVVVAAGRGERLGVTGPKALVELAGRRCSPTPSRALAPPGCPTRRRPHPRRGGRVRGRARGVRGRALVPAARPAPPASGPGSRPCPPTSTWSPCTTPPGRSPRPAVIRAVAAVAVTGTCSPPRPPCPSPTRSSARRTTRWSATVDRPTSSPSRPRRSSRAGPRVGRCQRGRDRRPRAGRAARRRRRRCRAGSCSSRGPSGARRSPTPT